MGSYFLDLVSQHRTVPSMDPERGGIIHPELINTDIELILIRSVNYQFRLFFKWLAVTPYSKKVPGMEISAYRSHFNTRCELFFNIHNLS